MQNLVEKNTKKIIDGLGIACVYVFASGKQKSIKAIFDYDYTELYEHNTKIPVFTVSVNDITATAGDQIKAQDQTFTIKVVEPDNLGAYILRCKKA